MPDTTVANLTESTTPATTDLLYLAAGNGSQDRKVKVTNLKSGLSLSTSDVSGAAADSSVVHLTGNETVAGIKTFSSPPVLSGASFTAGSVPYSKLNLTGSVLNADLAGSIAYSKLSLTGAILNADLAGSIAYSKLTLTGSVVNADVSASAAIAYSKLNLTGAVLNADLAGSIALTKFATQADQTILGNTSGGSASPSALTATQVRTLTGTGLDSLAAHLAGPETITGVKTFSATPVFSHVTVEGVTSTGATGTGSVVFASTPTLVTPVLGAATATSVLVNSSGSLANARVEAGGSGGTYTPFHAFGAYLGLSFVSTGLNGDKSALDTRSTRAPGLAALSAASSGSGYHSLQGDVLGAWHTGGSHDNSLVDCAQAYTVAVENFGDVDGTNSGTRFEFWTTAAGTESKWPSLIIDDDGGILAGGSYDTITVGSSTTRTLSVSTQQPTAWFGVRGTQTITSTFATATAPGFARDSGIYIFDAATVQKPFKRGFTSGPTLKNGSTRSQNWGTTFSTQTYVGFGDLATLTVDTQAVSDMGNLYSFHATPTVNRTNSGTFAAGAVYGFVSQPTIGAGCTMTQVTGFFAGDVANSGTVTTQYGLVVGALTSGTTNWGIKSQTAVQFTAGVYGGDLATATLSLYSTSHASKGDIRAIDPFKLVNTSGGLTTLAVPASASNFTVTFQAASGTVAYLDSPVFTTALTAAAPTFTGTLTAATSTFSGHMTIEGVTSTGATGTGKFVFDGTPTLVTPVIGVATGTSLAVTGLLKSSSATAGVGYATGAGGTVTQLTSKATTVICNTICGAITTHTSSLSGGTSTGFTLTNSAIAATDVVYVCMKSGGSADSYIVWADAVAAGSCRISIHNTSGGSLGEALVLNFAVIKAVTS